MNAFSSYSYVVRYVVIFLALSSLSYPALAKNHRDESIASAMAIPSSFPIKKKMLKEELNSLQFAVKNKRIHLSALSSDKLKEISNEELRLLLKLLSKEKTELLLEDSRGSILSKHYKFFHPFNKTKKTNAAAALAFMLAAEEDDEGLSRLIELSPDSIIPSFKKYAGDIISSEVMAQSLVRFSKEVDVKEKDYVELTKSHVNYAAQLFSLYIHHWAKKNPEKIIDSLDSMIKDIRHSFLDKTQKEKLSSGETGRLIGCILSGAFIHSAHIKAVDDRRTLIINSASNLTWALTSFLGVIPIAGSIASALGGTISTAVVVAAIVWNFEKPSRDFSSNITEFQGMVELGLKQQKDLLLEKYLPYLKEDEKRLELRTYANQSLEDEFNEIKMTLHLNGFKD